MAGDGQVKAGWALWSKARGSRVDYSVLGCSPEVFSRTDFAKIITRFGAGTPDTSATGPGELPWVTVSWVGVDDGLLGLAITDKTPHVDGTGRPITQTSYFCVPYPSLADGQVSYTALYDAVAGIQLAPEDGASMWLTLPATPVAEAARRVEEADDRIAGTAAALLLRGPVSVVQADGSTLRQRVEFIDAVASMLPYGLRAKLAAATWSDSGTRHRLRLAFASRPRDDAAAVTWRQGGEVSGDDTARAYYSQLRQLRSGAGYDRKFDLATVVEHLAGAVDAQKFEQPQEALRILRRLDLPDRVLRAFRDDAPVDLAELRAVYQLGHLEVLGDDERADLLTALSRMGQSEDWPTVRRSLEEVRDLRKLCEVLTEFGRRILWTATPDTAVLRECLTLAAARAAEAVDDHVLAGLVRSPQPRGSQPQATQAAADLLASTVLANDRARDNYPVTRQSVAASPAAMAEYLAALAGSGREAVDLLRWLAPQASSPLLVNLFGTALGLRKTEVTEADLAKLAQESIDCVRALLAAASAADRLETVLPGFTLWMASRADLSTGEQRYWSEHLRGLTAITPRLRAWLDLALLTVGADPAGLPPAGQSDGLDYLSGFSGLWTALRKYPPASGARCARALAKYLERQRWADSKGQADIVTRLAGYLLDYDSADMLAAVVGSGLAANPNSKRWEFAKDWLARVRAKDPQAISNGLLNSLATMEPGTDPAQIATLCLRAQRAGISDEAAFYRMRQSGAVDSGRRAVALVSALRREFEQAGVGPEDTEDWVLGFATTAIRGDYGPDLGQDFRMLMSRGILREVQFQIYLLHTIAETERQGRYELLDQERGGLAEMGEWIDAFLKRSPKPSPLRWVKRQGGDPAPAAESP